MDMKRLVGSHRLTLMILPAIIISLAWVGMAISPPPSSLCLIFAATATPLYFASHYVSLSVARAVLGPRRTSDRIALSAVLAFWLHMCFPVPAIYIFGRQLILPVALALAVLGTAVVMLRLIFSHPSDARPPPVEPPSE